MTYGQMKSDGTTDKTPTYTGQVLANGDDLLNNRSLGAPYRVVHESGFAMKRRTAVAYFRLKIDADNCATLLNSTADAASERYVSVASDG